MLHSKNKFEFFYWANVLRYTTTTVVEFSLGIPAIFSPLIPLPLCNIFPYQNGILIPQGWAALIYALQLILNYSKNEK